MKKKVIEFIRDNFAGLFIAVLFLIIHLLTINHYGITWDEPNRFNDGIALYNYLRGKTPKLIINNPAYGQLPGLLSAISYSIFYGKLGWLPYDSAVHLSNILFASTAVFLTFFIGKKLFNKKTGFYAALFLALYPRFISMAHQNIKDLPVITSYCLAIYFFYLFVSNFTPYYGLLAGLFFGLSYNVKINAIFIPLIFIVCGGFIFKKQKIKFNSIFLSSILIFIISSLFFIYIFRPAMWGNPLKNMIETYIFYRDVWRGGSVLYFGRFYKSGINVPWYYALSYFLLVTPIVMLIPFFLAIVCFFFKKEFFENFILVLLWFSLPLIRYLSPKAIILDDIRHFAEIIPAACLIAGVGIYKISQFLRLKEIIINLIMFLIIIFFP